MILCQCLLRVAYVYLMYLLVLWPEIVVRGAEFLFEMGEERVRRQPALVFVNKSSQLGIVLA